MERLEPEVPKPRPLSEESILIQEASGQAGDTGAFVYFRRFFVDGDELEREGDEVRSELVLVPLTGDEVDVGNHQDCEIVLDWDPTVARAHAQLRKAGADWYVDNLDRTNGTLVNGVRVDRVEEHFLGDGDRIRLGDTILIFRQPGLDRADPPEPMTSSQPPPPVTGRQKEVLVALVRPLAGTDLHVSPASNAEIAEEVFIDEETVKGHLRRLYEAFGLSDLPAGEKRRTLAWKALELGAVSVLDLDAR